MWGKIKCKKTNTHKMWVSDSAPKVKNRKKNWRKNGWNCILCPLAFKIIYALARSYMHGFEFGSRISPNSKNKLHICILRYRKPWILKWFGYPFKTLVNDPKLFLCYATNFWYLFKIIHVEKFGVQANNIQRDLWHLLNIRCSQLYN